MKELIWPNCHKAFTVDVADYASIVNQVKNAEFDEARAVQQIEIGEKE